MSLYSHQANLFSSPLVWSVVLSSDETLNWVIHDYDVADNRRVLTVSVLNSSNTKRAGIPLKISNRNRLFRYLESGEALKSLPIFRSQIEGVVYALWNRTNSSERRSWKRVLRTLRSWLNVFEDELERCSSLSCAMQRTNDLFFKAITSGEREIVPILGGEWHKIASEIRFDTALQFCKLMPIDEVFWSVCERCGARIPGVSVADNKHIDISAFCDICKIGLQSRWIYSDLMPSNIVPRVLLDDIMDVQLSNGKMYSYSSSLSHIQRAVDFMTFNDFKGSEGFYLVGGREYERRTWNKQIKIFDPIKSADLDFGRSSFIIFASLHTISPKLG